MKRLSPLPQIMPKEFIDKLTRQADSNNVEHGERERLLRLAAAGYNTSMPQYTFFDRSKHQEDEELRLSRLLDRETLFRFAYVPFVIAQLVWDYADTILTIAAWLRITETKPLCRAIKELRRDYDRIRAPYIDKAHANSEIENGYVFEDCVKSITDQLLLNLRIDIRSEYPEIEPEYLNFLLAVYQCDITLKSLLLYVRRQTDIIAKKIDRHVGRILPDAVYKLDKLILEFVGDKPVSKKFDNLKRQYIETFATQIALVGLNELPDND